MKKNSSYRDRFYDQLYNYSKQNLSLRGKFTKLIIKLLIYSIFGFAIFFSVDTFKNFQDYILFSVSITLAILVNFLIELVLENREIKRLKKQEKEYAQTLISLTDNYKKALQDIKARDEFLSIVSHELKTPLTTMLLKLHSELNNIQKASLANFSVPELISVLKNSEVQIKRLKSIVNDLLDVSLVTTGRMNLQLENVDLVSLTKQICQSFSEILKKKQCKVKVFAKTPVAGKWDKMRLEQVITNLFSNALEYGKGEPINIQIFKKGKSAKFIIRDNGIGINSEEQKNIFDLFKRASNVGEYKKGLGVGLFITSQIVKKHGGKIKVSSTPHKGTTFTLQLPIENRN